MIVREFYSKIEKKENVIKCLLSSFNNKINNKLYKIQKTIKYYEIKLKSIINYIKIQKIIKYYEIKFLLSKYNEND